VSDARDQARETSGTSPGALPRGVVLALRAGAVLLVLLAIAWVVLPMRTLTTIELVTPGYARGTAPLSVQLELASGEVQRAQRVDPRGGLVFSRGEVRAVRIEREGCKPRTFELSGCTETLHFTDYFRYFHHGSASHYERKCKLAVTLECP